MSSKVAGACVGVIFWIVGTGSRCSAASVPHSIGAIQGEGHRSAYEGKHVRDVRGVVTAIARSGKRPIGFYFQDPHGDGNPKTSDGIFVYCGKAFPDSLRVGDYVAVLGTVSEYISKGNARDLSVTQLVIKRAQDVRVLAHGRELPEPVLISYARVSQPVFVSNLADLAPDAETIDFYESVEGMRVQMVNPTVPAVAYRSTYYLLPGDTPSTRLNMHGGYVYEQTHIRPVLAFCPRRMFDSLPEVFKSAPPLPGDSFEGTVVGIMGYSSSSYQLELAEPLPPLRRSGFSPEVSTIQFNARFLNIASYNVENFSAGNKADSARARVFAKHFVNDLKAPDVICLVEIQDDDGAKKHHHCTSAQHTLDLLVRAMAEFSAVRYKAVNIDPQDNAPAGVQSLDADGGQPGGNIRCCYLYRTDRVQLVQDQTGSAGTGTFHSVAQMVCGGRQMVKNPARIGVGQESFQNTRKSLVAHFQFVSGVNKGKDFVVVTNHFSSKRGDDPVWGSTQPAQEHSKRKRIQQAAQVAAFVAALRRERADLPVVVAGDFNDFWFSDVIQKFTAVGMHSALDLLPETERYTYVYRGYSQTLDNILSVGARTETADILHINAEQPARERVSDHDPVFVQLSW